MTYPLYRLPDAADAVDQGDLIEGCPVLLLASYDPITLVSHDVESPTVRVLVLTQAVTSPIGRPISRCAPR